MNTPTCLLSPQASRFSHLNLSNHKLCGGDSYTSSPSTVGTNACSYHKYPLPKTFSIQKCKFCGQKETDDNPLIIICCCTNDRGVAHSACIENEIYATRRLACQDCTAEYKFTIVKTVKCDICREKKRYYASLLLGLGIMILFIIFLSLGLEEEEGSTKRKAYIILMAIFLVVGISVCTVTLCLFKHACYARIDNIQIIGYTESEVEQLQRSHLCKITELPEESNNITEKNAYDEMPISDARGTFYTPQTRKKSNDSTANVTRFNMQCANKTIIINMN